MAEDCLFCKIAAGEIHSDEVYSDEAYYAFRDIDPAAPTHILLIPRKHIARVTDAEEGDRDTMGGLLFAANEIARREGLVGEGLRYVINTNGGGGQTVYHIHLHILGGRQMTWPPG
ncbi:MAG TPA: histidine triad nucleotide-binding protein [Gammaproteobacteria bacterium]|jgi:histidine triad (HIT) family protein|nr:histidine triad nucleotide-binding protein [Candidatus Hydrogenedentota bacterium]HJP34870.1 histidine triad nucleotide-binding protein [Gammaproteobacteria bacterium]